MIKVLAHADHTTKIDCKIAEVKHLRDQPPTHKK